MPIKDPIKLREARKKDYARPGRKEAIIASNKIRQEQLKQRYAEYKLSKGCNRCGYNKNSKALDPHHLKDKEISLSVAVRNGWSWKRILEELEKCEILCANCHREEHS